MRRPSRTALRPVKRLIIEPTPNKATAVNATAATSAPSPRANRNGARGTSAPTPKEKNEDSAAPQGEPRDRKSTRLNSSHLGISYAVFCLKKKKKKKKKQTAVRRTSKS